MTNTPMSEREKALLEAVRAFIANTKAFYGDQVEIPRLESAIKAYDPKPVEVTTEERIARLERAMLDLQCHVIGFNAAEIEHSITSRTKAPTE